MCSTVDCVFIPYTGRGLSDNTDSIGVFQNYTLYTVITKPPYNSL